MVDLFERGLGPKVFLDIGSGRQSLEKELKNTHKNRSWMDELEMFTVDMADIVNYKLLLARSKKVHHIRGDALLLPFDSSQFGLVVSNHAIDFLPRESFSEAARVLSPDGYAIFYFHHPSMIKSPSKNPKIEMFWKYLRDNEILFKDEDQIREELRKRGLAVEEIHLNDDRVDKWWEVVSRKSTS